MERVTWGQFLTIALLFAMCTEYHSHLTKTRPVQDAALQHIAKLTLE